MGSRDTSSAGYEWLWTPKDWDISGMRVAGLQPRPKTGTHVLACSGRTVQRACLSSSGQTYNKSPQRPVVCGSKWMLALTLTGYMVYNEPGSATNGVFERCCADMKKWSYQMAWKCGEELGDRGHSEHLYSWWIYWPRKLPWYFTNLYYPQAVQHHGAFTTREDSGITRVPM